MRQQLTILNIAISVLGLVRIGAFAQDPPPAMNYQGILKDAEGGLLEGQRTFQFRVHDSESGGVVVWGPQTLTAPVIAGRFNVILTNEDVNAGGEPVTVAFVGDGLASRYFSVAWDGVEQGPRQQVLGVPAAMTVANGAITRAKLANGSVGGGQVEDGSLSGDDLADGAISPRKLSAPNMAFSSSLSGEWSIDAFAPTSFTAITPLAVSITTAGRPVLLSLQAIQGSESPAYIGLPNSGGDAGKNECEIRIRETVTGTTVSVQRYQNVAGGALSSSMIPASAISAIHTAPQGTYNYVVEVRVTQSSGGSAGTKVRIANCRLMAHEL